ncbi:bifunctional helix-turn-helix transcriptional regulator/GNAT family N-acetyltransferase [Marinitenerispora sediminis]|uniref:MarR family transcriptional regulator n=1 Tax=Marinitenerispora sediminis TaxID=1931232 RepID=A0A368T9P4_9ACTN|nr:helix-turn-helix domain-containing GNAT family N-acetyltransferase [Marinitenerispora sediminis]RCV54758.1 MarR family transcriptional regulator [Marinitenerispora sediminis]RCV60566.1 MarR family transcriptional regulator [Marinitenerispora sediminis]RCV61032.1 MarR family transcriptional regulator [Marinitenerispora sediminis]
MDALSPAETPVSPEDVAEIRAFSRFFTNRLGVLRAGLLDTRWSLTEARVMYELARSGRTELADLRRELDIDAGQLSRVVARLVDGGLLTRHPSPADGRRQVLELTAAGTETAAMLDGRASEQVRAELAPLHPADRQRLVTALATARRLLTAATGPAARPGTVLLRPLRPGDLGWMVQRNAALYAAEYGFDQTYEALVAEIVADYGRSHDPHRETGWIAELDGEPAGCVLCVRGDDTTAKLRLLLVEPSARGNGIGSRLVAECLSFARAAGYRRMTLWTNDVLTSARRIYGRAGFTRVRAKPHRSFGVDLVGETWERDL